MVPYPSASLAGKMGVVADKSDDQYTPRTESTEAEDSVCERVSDVEESLLEVGGRVVDIEQMLTKIILQMQQIQERQDLQDKRNQPDDSVPDREDSEVKELLNTMHEGLHILFTERTEILQSLETLQEETSSFRSHLLRISDEMLKRERKDKVAKQQHEADLWEVHVQLDSFLSAAEASEPVQSAFKRCSKETPQCKQRKGRKASLTKERLASHDTCCKSMSVGITQESLLEMNRRLIEETESLQEHSDRPEKFFELIRALQKQQEELRETPQRPGDTAILARLYLQQQNQDQLLHVFRKQQSRQERRQPSSGDTIKRRCHDNLNIPSWFKG